MSLTDSLKKEFCFCPLEGRTKDELLENLVSCFSTAYGLNEDEKDEVLKAIMDREKLGSTGFGDGIAIPHAKVKEVEGVQVALAVGKDDVDYSSLDNKPTRIYFLVLANPECSSEHVQVLSQIAMVAKNSSMVRLIRSAKSKNDLINVFFN